MGLLSITIVELYFLLFLTVILCRDSIESTPFVVVIAKKSWNGADFGSSDWRASGGCWRARLFPGSERARLKEAPKQICPPPAFAAADPDLVYSRSKTHPDTLRLALLYLLYSTTQINPSTSSSCSSLLLSLVTTSIRTSLESVVSAILSISSIPSFFIAFLSFLHVFPSVRSFHSTRATPVEKTCQAARQSI